MTTKFSASRARGKTPSICRSPPPPEYWDVPDYPIPDIHGNLIWLAVCYRSFAPDHPWNYSSCQLLRPTYGPFWQTNESTDPDFVFSCDFAWYPISGRYTIHIYINHQGHGPHHANLGPAHYTNGQPFYFGRTGIIVDNPSRYKCNISLTI